MKQPIFKASHIVKQFGPTIALNDVDIEIYAGEIRGFIGENGSGKSTMSALMTGIHQKTSGTMWYHGEVWEPGSMIEALNGGIGIIVQENGTISEISVAENIFLGELKQFAGVNYFESKKIEDFSPLFDLDINTIVNIKKEYAALMAEKPKAEAKKLLKQAKAALMAEYKKLNEKLLADNTGKKAQIVGEFDALAEKAFADFNQQIAAIDQKYTENAEGLDEVIKNRRLNNDVKEAKKAYSRLIKGAKNKTYMKLDWVAKDVQSLKNCYLNNYQDLKLAVENKAIRALKNFFLNAIFGLFVNGKKLRKHAGYALSKIGVNDIRPEVITAAYDMQQRKLIEIAKCLNKNPEIFIVDETTTALSETGRNLLYKKMEELKNAGKSVLFISHDLDELMEKCDTLTVLRDGNIVANLDKAKGEFDPEQIKKFMIGRELKGDYYLLQ